MTTDNTSQILWSKYTSALAALMGAGGTEASLQVLPMPSMVYGNSGADMTTALSIFASQIPAWGAIYQPSASRVIDAYQIALTQVKETATNGKSYEAEYETENTKLADMMGKASAFKVSCISNWTTTMNAYTKAGLPTQSFTDWFVTNGAQEYNTLLAAQTQQTKKVSDLLKAEGVASPVVEALARLNDEIDAAAKLPAPAVTANPSADMLFNWKTKPTNPGGFSFDSKSSTYDYTKTTWQSQTGVKLFGFISIGSRTETHTQENIFTTTSDYSMDLKFGSQATVSLLQGSWFDAALLVDYKNGPWIKNSQFDKGLAHPYGQDGVLPLVVTSAYVVMNPTITVTLSKTEFTSFYETMSGSFASGVNLGPFAFGGSASQGTSNICKNSALKDTQSFTLSDTSNIPQIIAVSNQIMP